MKIVKHLIYLPIISPSYIKNRLKDKWWICCPVKSYHATNMEKYKKFIQKQTINTEWKIWITW